MTKSLAFTVFITLLTFNCAHKIEELPFINENISEYGKDVSKSINHFAIDIYKILSKSEGNLIFSPFSISMSTGMLLLMANGSTATEIAEAMHIKSNTTTFCQGFYEIFKKLNGKSLLLGSRIFLQEGFQIKNSFEENIQNYFETGLENINYTAAENARKYVNSWVEKKTKGKIVELLPSGVVTEETKMVLVSTIFFKEKWHYPFPLQRTTEHIFHLGDGTSTSVQMMRGHKRLSYFTLNAIDADILHIPYMDGQQSMVIILPKKYNGLPKLEESLSRINLKADILDVANYTKVLVVIPKFKLEESFELKPVFVESGIKSAFSHIDADFSNGIMAGGLEVSSVQHRACVEVDEEGTEAGAATGMVVHFKSGFSFKNNPSFIADHPFMFFIIDSPSKAILFAGRFVSPS